MTSALCCFLKCADARAHFVNEGIGFVELLVFIKARKGHGVSKLHGHTKAGERKAALHAIQKTALTGLSVLPSKPLCQFAMGKLDIGRAAGRARERGFAREELSDGGEHFGFVRGG